MIIGVFGDLEEVETAVGKAKRVGDPLILSPSEGSVETRLILSNHFSRSPNPSAERRSCKVCHRHSRLVGVDVG